MISNEAGRTMRIAPLLALALVVPQAEAFDAWGFRSGMSEAEVDTVARRATSSSSFDPGGRTTLSALRSI
jgi:hypothetical protein